MHSKILSILFVFIFFNFFTCLSQDEKGYCNDIEDIKIIQNYEKAINSILTRKYDEAEKILSSIVSAEPEFAEAWAALAEIHYIRYENSYVPKDQETYFSRYIFVLEKIVEICPGFQDYELSYLLGNIYFLRKDYDKSLKNLNVFIKNGSEASVYYTEAEQTIKYINEYLELLKNEVPFNPIVVEGLSTEDDEYLPLMSPDGTLALFTRSYLKNDASTSYRGKFVEEFTIGEPADGSGLIFSNIEPMPYPFNTGRNQGAATITIDNNTLFMTICESIDRSYTNCDIYYSERKNNRWTELKNMGPNINGVMTWESQPSISADGKILYFASIRPENIGFDPNNPTSDIYYSVKNADGSWSKAKNMGPSINTSGNEKSPFIHSDSQTLYFSSDGHVGVGGYDIFYSRFRDGEWVKPVNIGYPINTVNDDIGFVVNTQGTRAYFASNKLKGKGGWDIYAIDLYKEARPERVFLVKGQLIDDEGRAITEAKLEVRNVTTSEISEGMVDAETGNYAVAVTSKDEDEGYLMVVKKEGYNFTSSLIEPEEEIFETTQVVDFEVKPIEEGKTVELNDIYFATASYEIDKKSYSVLNSFIEFLNENPNISIEIRGHTDNTGSLQTNMILSDNRAKAVYNYLINNGINVARLSYKGYGPNIPVASNDTESGRAKNRRTEFFIVSK
ncbi:MAG: OmpA family protein [Bacteroidales bacterium]|jgi:outer membrane protein OmpA-like peptidoglycan-associated protein/tetratricopeptide (TPR) repeat protein|nr:OmpA family protein [Bacteroidales bacterium]